MFLILTTPVFASGSSENTSASSSASVQNSSGTVSNLQGSGNSGAITIDTSNMSASDVAFYSNVNESMNLILVENSAGSGALNRLAWTFSNILDRTTKSICLALSPYPKALAFFYPTLFEESSSSSNINNIDNVYGNKENTLNTVFMNRNRDSSGSVFMKDPYSEDVSESSAKSSDNQKSTTNMLMIIIMSLFLAEILFSVIYSYVTGGEEPVLKTLLVKAVTCLLIGALIMSLPFIIEGMKYGFDKAVKTMSGATTRAEDNPENENEVNIKHELYKIIVSSSSFEYPGLLVRLMTFQLRDLDPESTGVMTSFKTENTWGAINGALVNLLFFLVKIIVFIIALIASLHVMFNVIEVYVLLSLGLLLLPFQIFRLTSFMGTGVFRSLMANIVQLIVICFIMVVLMPVVTDVSISVWASVMETKATDKEAAWNYTTLNSGKTKHETSLKAILDKYAKVQPEGSDFSNRLEDLWREEIIIDKNTYKVSSLAAATGFDIHIMYRMSATNEIVPQYTLIMRPIDTVPDMKAYSTFHASYNVKFSELLKEVIETSLEVTTSAEYYGKDFAKDLDKSQKINIAKAEWTSDPGAWWVDSVNMLATTMGNSYGVASSVNMYSSPNKNLFVSNLLLNNGIRYESLAIDDAQTGWSLVFAYLITAMSMVYLQFFFIHRSSQISEGLLNGRDSGPDFARMLSARAVGGVARAAGKVATAPVRGGAALATTGARLATANIGQSLSNAGHTALGGMLMAMSHVGSTQGQSATTIGNQKNTEANTNRDSKNG